MTCVPQEPPLNRPLIGPLLKGLEGAFHRC